MTFNTLNGRLAIWGQGVLFFAANDVTKTNLTPNFRNDNLFFKALKIKIALIIANNNIILYSFLLGR